MRSTLLLMFLFQIHSVYADVANLDPAVLEAQTTRLTRLLRPYVVPLDRDMITFHYEQPSSDFQPTSVSQLQERYLRARSFFIPSVDDSNETGPGIYVSVDPVGSRDFGGWTDPQLYVFTIKKNARLLNTTPTITNRELKIIKEIGSAVNCAASFAKLNALSDVTAYFRDNSNKDCARTIISTFERLKVQGVLYDYDASSSLAGCRGRDEAINIVSPEIIDPSSIAYFSRAKQIYTPPLAGYLRELYREGAQDFTLKYQSSNLDLFLKVTDGLDRETILQRDYLRWRNQNIYKCGTPWSTELTRGRSPLLTGLAQRFQNVLINAYRDSEVQALLLSAKAAYAKRVASETLDTKTRLVEWQLMRMNQIELMLYRASGLASDDSKFDQWKKAVDFNTNSELDEMARGKQVERLLEEDSNIKPLGDNEDLAVKLASYFKQNPTNRSGVYFAMWRLLGYGLRYQAVFSNELIVTYGSAPLLTRAALRDTDRKNAQIQAANRNLFLNILNRCIADYKDPSIKAEDLAKGPCGFRESNSTATN